MRGIFKRSLKTECPDWLLARLMQCGELREQCIDEDCLLITHNPFEFDRKYEMQHTKACDRAEDRKKGEEKVG